MVCKRSVSSKTSRPTRLLVSWLIAARLDPRARGNAIEAAVAETDYKDWYQVGSERNVFFPLVDFQRGNTLVSLKSVDTNGTGWMGRM